MRFPILFAAAVLLTLTCAPREERSDGAPDPTPRIVIDGPTVVGYFPPALDSAAAEESGYAEGLAHVGFALQDAKACTGLESAAFQMVVDTQIYVVLAGRTDMVPFPRTDATTFGIYLFRSDRPPHLVTALAPSALNAAVLETLPAYFEGVSCAPREP